MITLKVKRNKKSYDYKLDPTKNFFSNNTKNNCLDSIHILQDGNIIYSYPKVQTVANYPNSDTKDTIAKGKFQVKLFVEKRKYKNEVHGIINALDLEGQKIDEFSMQKDNGFTKGRWLIHDTYDPVLSKDLNFAWSQGCFVFKTSADLKLFNKVLIDYGCKEGDIIDGVLEEL